MIIEAVVFASFILLFRGFLSSRTNIISFFAVTGTSFLLEVVNEKFFSSQGTFYPSSILYVPSFRFPVAIICLSAVYSFLIFLSARKISGYFKDGAVKAVVFMVFVTVFNFFSILIEKAGMSSGYWVHQKAASVTEIWLAVYGYYFIMVFPGAVFVLRDIVISGRMPQNRYR
ncbi:MAG TPA: hypothetical protein P5044_03565 [bacterium]|nr:hypothetical protein [bacterium]